MIDHEHAAVGGDRAARRRAPPTPRPPRRARCRARRRPRSGARAGRPGASSGADRLQRRPPTPSSSWIAQLGLVVGALAVVVLEQAARLVEQVARRPAEVLVLVPDLAARRRSRPGSSIPSRATAALDRVGVGGGREAGRVNADHAQAVALVALVPGLQVGQRAHRVRPAEVPELDQHRAGRAAGPCAGARR